MEKGWKGSTLQRQSELGPSGIPAAAAGARQHRCCVFPVFPAVPGASSRGVVPSRTRLSEPGQGRARHPSHGFLRWRKTEPWERGAALDCARLQESGEGRAPDTALGTQSSSLYPGDGAWDGPRNYLCAPPVMISHGLCPPGLLTELTPCESPELPIPVCRERRSCSQPCPVPPGCSYMAGAQGWQDWHQGHTEGCGTETG